MSDSVFWLDGVMKSEVGHNFVRDIAEAIIEVFGGEEVFLKARTELFADDELSDTMLTQRADYLKTGLTNKEAIAKLFLEHKEGVLWAVEKATHEYGEEAIADSVEYWFGFKEDPENTILDTIENDEVEKYPEMVQALTLYACMEFCRQVSLFLVK